MKEEFERARLLKESVEFSYSLLDTPFAHWVTSEEALDTFSGFLKELKDNGMEEEAITALNFMKVRADAFGVTVSSFAEKLEKTSEKFIGTSIGSCLIELAEYYKKPEGLPGAFHRQANFFYADYTAQDRYDASIKSRLEGFLGLCVERICHNAKPSISRSGQLLLTNE